MEEIPIVQHLQIGKIRLDMKKADADKLFNQSFMWLHAGDTIYYNYEDYRIGYRNEEITEISILKSENDSKAYILYSKDIFHEKAEDLIANLSEYDDYTFDTEDKNLSFEYYFKNLGLSFWREQGFRAKLLNDPEFYQ